MLTGRSAVMLMNIIACIVHLLVAEVLGQNKVNLSVMVDLDVP